MSTFWKRIPQEEIWSLYSHYPFVLSTRGNGLDCHRTWELLLLGSIVITRTSPLDPLFRGSSRRDRERLDRRPRQGQS